MPQLDVPKEVVSPELVLIAPELAVVTWRAESRAAHRAAIAAGRRAATETPLERNETPLTVRRSFLRPAFVLGAIAVSTGGFLVVSLLPGAATKSSQQLAATASFVGKTGDLPTSTGTRDHNVTLSRAGGLNAVPAVGLTQPSSGPEPAARDITSLSVSVGPGGVALRWTASSNAPLFLVARRRIDRHSGSTVVYRGRDHTFVDDGPLVSGGLYRYVVFVLRSGLRRSPGVPALVRR
jgi:hypothetical protein